MRYRIIKNGFDKYIVQYFSTSNDWRNLSEIREEYRKFSTREITELLMGSPLQYETQLSKIYKDLIFDTELEARDAIERHKDLARKQKIGDQIIYEDPEEPIEDKKCEFQTHKNPWATGCAPRIKNFDDYCRTQAEELENDKKTESRWKKWF